MTCYYNDNSDFFFYPENTILLLSENMKLKNIIFMPLIYFYDDDDDSSHQTIIVIDNYNKIAFRFNPWGTWDWYETIIDNHVKNSFSVFFQKNNYHFYMWYEYNKFPFQKNHDDDRLFELGGYCMYWTTWFCEMYLINYKTLNIHTFCETIYCILKDKQIWLSEYIRAYSFNSYNVIMKICEKENINISFIRNKNSPYKYLLKLHHLYNKYFS